jgi:hypothetical protein
MRASSFFLSIAILVAVSATGVCQPISGLTWTGASAAVIGCPCAGFTCTPFTTTATAGESISISVRGDLVGTYFLAVSSPVLCGSPAGTVCTPFLAINNSLILSSPICGPPLFLSGALATPTPACGALLGSDTISATFPNAGAFPVGSVLTIQALVIFATAAVNPEFTCAITVTAI